MKPDTEDCVSRCCVRCQIKKRAECFLHEKEPYCHLEITSYGAIMWEDTCCAMSLKRQREAIIVVFLQYCLAFSS